jgi:hypothetical protein
MARRRADPNLSAPRRFSVTVDAIEYDRLVKIAEDHKPRLTLQYVVQYAIQTFLHDVDSDKSSVRDMADPRRRGKLK